MTRREAIGRPTKQPSALIQGDSMAIVFSFISFNLNGIMGEVIDIVFHDLQ